MWLRNVVEMKERYSRERLPEPLDTAAWVCWKVLGKPIVKISAGLLAKSQGFTFPQNWEWTVKSLVGLYEQETVDLCVRVIKSGMTVIDVGAHVGYYSRLFAELAGPQGEVYAFEPHPENFYFLKKNTSRFANIALVNKALSDKAGSTRLFLNTKSGGHSLFVQPHTFSSMRVGVMTLDQFWAERGKPDIHFIKMDIEGAEARALKGARGLLEAQKRLAMVTEFCPAHLRTGGTAPEEFLSLLSGLGFRYAAIGAGGELLTEMPQLTGLKYVNLFCEKN